MPTRFVKPSGIDGALDAPPSKSATQRAVMLAALTRGKSVIRSPSECEDSRAAARVAEALGARVVKRPGEWRVEGAARAARSPAVDCGESAFCVRAGIPAAALAGRALTLTGSRTLSKRPLGNVERPMRSLGASCETRGGFAPAKVSGPLAGGKASVDASLSSQFASGLAMSLPLAERDSEIIFKQLASRRYLDMTLDAVRAFDGTVDDGLPEGFRTEGGQTYRPADFTVEGDWSGASFLLVAGAIAGRLTVRGLDMGSRQPDSAILEALRLAGAGVSVRPGSVTVGPGDLDGFQFDVTACPDLLPPLAALACHCRGRTTIEGAGRTRAKESDRAAALAAELAKLGARMRVRGDSLVVDGGPLRGGRADSRGDHRIAMALAVAGLRSGRGARISHEGCVSKSYPRFFEDLEGVMEG